MLLKEGSLQFNFTGALHAFKFDEPNSSLEATFHGLSHCMKAVDFVVEYEAYYLFVEIKDPPHSGRYDTSETKRELIRNLVQKFRDTFLYRWAEKKLDKPIRYQCLVEVDNALTSYLIDQLKKQLPTGIGSRRWQQPLATSCVVVNREKWNQSFPEMQVTRIS